MTKAGNIIAAILGAFFTLFLPFVTAEAAPGGAQAGPSSMAGILTLIIFAILVALIMRETIPAILGLILMGIFLPLVAGVPGRVILDKVLAEGAVAQGKTIIIIIFGAWIGQVLVKTGIAQSIIRMAAELGGDKPLLVVLLISLATAFISVGLYGLGPIIMIGVMALPIMMTLGVSAQVATTIYLLSTVAGYMLNLTLWGSYQGITKVAFDQLMPMPIIMAIVVLVFAIVYVWVHVSKLGHASAWAVQTGSPETSTVKRVNGLAMLSPIIPVLAYFFLRIDVIPSLMIGILWAFVTTAKGRSWKETVEIFHKSIYDAFPDAAPVIMLWIAVSILLAAVTLPQVSLVIKGLMGHIAPTSKLGFIIFFILLMPLSLYRGPLNILGLGAGVFTAMVSLGAFSPLALFAGWVGTIIMVSVTCPTVSWVAWACSYTGTPVAKNLVHTLPWTWAIGAIAVIVAAILFL